MGEATAPKDSNGKSTEPEKTDRVMQEIDDSKAQIIWNGDSLLITIPTDKVSRTFARGLLREAEDMIIMHYIKRAQQRQMIVNPSHNFRNKLSKFLK